MDGTSVKALALKKDSSKQTINFTFNSGNYENLELWLYYQQLNDGNQKNGDSYGIYSNIQIEEGTQATEYEPYVEPTTYNIYLDEPLRKIGDYADYIDFSTGTVVRNIKEKIFNGTESSYINAFFTNADGHQINNINGYKKSSNNGLCNYFEPKSASGSLTQGIVFGTNINIVTSTSMGLSTPDKFSTWLAEKFESGNPVIIQYILDTPTEETIDLPELKTFEDYTRIEILTEIAPSKIEATYDGYEIK